MLQNQEWLGAVKFNRSFFICFQAGALVEELSRVSAENKKLTEMLTVLCENYNALRNHLMDYMSKNPEIDSNSGSKKRKSESITTNNNNDAIIDATNGPSESSSSDEAGSCKKPREEHIKAKVSREYVRTEASDTSLVSLQIKRNKTYFMWEKLIKKLMWIWNKIS